MTKVVKEFLLDNATGDVSFEYDDNSTSKYNLSNAVTATQSAQGVVNIGAGDISISVSQAALQSNRLPKWARAVAGVVAGVANAKICFVGDSTTACINATGTQKYTHSYAYQFARYANSQGIPASADSTYGDPTRLGGVGLNAYDPRVSMPGGWASGATFTTAGGVCFLNTTDTASLSFTPVEPFDTMTILSINNTGYGTWTCNIDGGATLATVDNNTTRGIRSTVVSASAGLHTLTINRVSGSAMIHAAIPSLSTQKRINVAQLGVGSSKCSEWGNAAGSAIEYFSALKFEAPDLTVIDLGINDRRLAYYDGTFDVFLTNVVQAAQITGDAVLCMSIPSAIANSVYTSQVNQDAHDAAILRVAAATGAQIYNKRARFGTYEADPTWYYDQLHLTPAGYGIVGIGLSQFVFDGIR